MSPWYHAIPNGAPGFWITKKSKSVFGGRPATSTSITSTAPRGLMRTVAVAFARQPDATGLAARTMLNSCLSLSLAAAGVLATPTRVAAATAAAPIPFTSFIESPIADSFTKMDQRSVNDPNIGGKRLEIVRERLAIGERLVSVR